MRRFRFSIAGLMGIVLIAAVGLAGLRNASPLWAGTLLMLTCAALALAVVGAIYCRGPRQAWWLGFAIFGWGYLALLKGCSDPSVALHPLSVLLEIFGDRVILPPPRIIGGSVGGSGLGGAFGGPIAPPPLVDRAFAIVAQCLWTLAIAMAGSILARIVFASARTDRAEETPQAPPPRIPWARPIAIGLTATTVIIGIAAIRSKDYAPELAGMTFSLTCLLVGLAVLGAVVGRGRRAAWTGAALFGVVYLAMVFSRTADRAPRPYLATDAILNVLRPRLSPAAGRLRANTLRIREELEKPLSMPFETPTPMEDILKYVQQSSRFEGRPSIPIYVDPIGLQAAEVSMAMTVQINLEGVPLRETLRLALKQLRLKYQVRDGYLRITWEGEQLVSDLDDPAQLDAWILDRNDPASKLLSSAIDDPTQLDDPFVIVGHCLAAVLAAGLGAIAGPIVAGRRAGQVSTAG